MRFASPLALMALAASVLVAGAAQAEDASPSSVQAGAYKLDPSHAQLVFSLSHMGFSTWYGDFSGISGALDIDPRNPAAASVEISIPVASLHTINATVDQELKSAAWLDATQFPIITFKSTKVTLTGARTADVIGDLTFHGQTHPITLHVSYKGSGPNMMSKAFTVGFDATSHLRRSEYGVMAYIPHIGDDVDLQISAPFEKK